MCVFQLVSKFQEGENFTCSQCLEQCLLYNSNLLNICSMSERMVEWMKQNRSGEPLLISYGELLHEQIVERLTPKENSVAQSLFWGWVVYWFSIIAVTKYHTLKSVSPLLLIARGCPYPLAGGPLPLSSKPTMNDKSSPSHRNCSDPCFCHLFLSFRCSFFTFKDPSDYFRPTG